MKLKLRIAGVFLFFTLLTIINFFSIDVNGKNDINLDTLIKVALANGDESGGELMCSCVDCPSDETGCWSYKSGAPCDGSVGYEGSWQCEGAGRIESHVIECNGPC